MDAAIDLAQLSYLIGLIYDCAINPDRWADTIDAIRTMLGFTTASLDLVSLPEGVSLLNVMANIAEPYASTMLKYAPQVSDMWGGADVVMNLPLDQPAVLTRVRPDLDGLWQHPMYVEWAAPQGISDILALWLSRDAGMTGVLAFGWPAAAGSIGDRELGIARLLLPHMQRATAITRLLDIAALRDATFGALFDTLDAPVLVVGADLTIVHANRAGRMLLDRAGTLRSQSGTLAMADPGARLALDAAIRDATGDISVIGRKGIGIPLRNIDGDTGVLHVLPLRPDHPGGRRLAAIFVARAHDAPASNRSVVKGLFSLTTTETAVFEQIAGGNDVPGTSKALGVAQSTVRTHLLRIYDKTGVRRQADLARLSASLAIPMSAD